MAVLFQLLITFSIFLGAYALCPKLPVNVECVHGNKLDVYDCPTCRCIDGCALIRCKTGYSCQSSFNGLATCCSNIPCEECLYGYTQLIDLKGCPVCKCVRCPEPMCPCNCPLGHKLDRYGCKTCDCNTPCDNFVCPEGQHCVTEYVGCENNPFCALRPKCVITCLPVRCYLYCPYGFQRNCDNCPVCRCREPCDKVVCPKHHHCVVKDTFCNKPPCPDPEAYCRSVCKPGQLLLKDDMPVDCFPSNVDSCGPNGKCTIIDKKTGQNVCCTTLPVV